MADNIETRINAVTDITTPDQLDALKSEINCLDPGKLQSLRELIDAKQGIKDATRTKLRELLTVCQILPETQKSPETFGQIFEGTQSDMLNPENIKGLKAYILIKFEQFKTLDSFQKDNLATASIDRLLSDESFSRLLGDMTGDITGTVKSLETGGVSALLNTAFADKKTEDATKTKVENTATGIMGRIQSIIDSATKPLVDLLAKTPTPAGLDGFLSNPRAIAAYDGSGIISADITKLNDADKAEYAKNLNKRILEIDGKIISLEGLRERGMDFVATAPNWMQDIFKWLLSLPIIGDLLASFLGHKDGTEALTGMSEELRQRKSVLALKEFRSQNPDGSKYEGKYAGKIDILKGKDLSKLDRKKLKSFFEFTTEEKLDPTTPDFWREVFNKKIVGKKDTEGKEASYDVEEIKEEDLKNGFKGLYEKLNKLHDIVDEKKRKEYSEQQAKIAVTTSVPLATTPSVILTETIKAPITLAEIGTLTAVGALKPEQRSLIHIGDQSDWRSSLGKTVVLAEIKNISKDVTVIDEFCKNNPAFMKALRKESRQTIVNLEDFWKYKDKAIITINILPSVVAATATPQVATATPVKPPEVPKDEKTLLVEAFRIENNLPFDFKVGTENKTVKFENGRLKIGEKQFALKIGIVGDSGPDVSRISLVGPDVELKFLETSTKIPRDKIITGIPGLLAMTTGAKNEIVGEKGKLIITRMA